MRGRLAGCIEVVRARLPAFGVPEPSNQLEPHLLGHAGLALQLLLRHTQEVYVHVALGVAVGELSRLPDEEVAAPEL